MLIVYGVYSFRPKFMAFRNDYCLSCAGPRRSVQIRTFDVVHIFWIPLIPLFFHKRWQCTTCKRSPHVSRRTRRAFKWVGLAVLLILAVGSWAEPLTGDIVIFDWVLRIGSLVGVILTSIHLWRTRRDPSLKELLGQIPPAMDTVCPFCGAALLTLSSHCSCPACGVARL